MPAGLRRHGFQQVLSAFVFGLTYPAHTCESYKRLSHNMMGVVSQLCRQIIMLLFHEWNILSQSLLNLSAYFERHRQEYYDHLLAVSQLGRWEEWLRFFLRGISVQA